jgi:hypothetical protein
MPASVPANQKLPALHIQLSEETHPFYTCGNKVRGTLRVEPTLRPQRISLIFKGVAVIYYQTINDATPSLFSREQILFESSGAHENFDILKKGTAADGKVELPFEFEFPYTVEKEPPSDRKWWRRGDSFDHPRFQHSPGFPLPPSCSTQVAASKDFSPRIIYTLEASLDSILLETPRIKARQELRFIPPAPEYDSRLLQPMVELGTKIPKGSSQYKLIRTRKLLPGYKESSKLGKVRDVLVKKEFFFGLNSYTEVPYAKFNILATPARVQIIGSYIPIILSLQHLDRSESLPDPPEVIMRRMRVQILSTFHIFHSRLPTVSRKEIEEVETAQDTLVLTDRKFEEGSGHVLLAGPNPSVMEGIQLAHEKLIPSFTSYGLALEHELQVDVWGECAGSEFSGIACRQKVQVVSGWNATASQAAGPAVEADARPAYDELDSMIRYEMEGQATRPHLNDRAPSYDDYASPPTQPVAHRPMPPPYMA